MKRTILTLTAGMALYGALLLPAFANHETGEVIAPELLVAGDYNEDGNLDLLVNCAGFAHEAVLIGDGQGGFTLAGHFAADTLPKGLQVADIDGDGHLDAVVANNWGYDETVLLGDGKGSFHILAPPSEVDGDGEPVRMLLRDFNNDGKLDIAVNAPDDNSILLFFGDGKGNFPAPDSEIEDVPHPFGMASADLNGDGNLDIVNVSPIRGGNSVMTVYMGDGTGEFTLGYSSPTSAFPTSVKIGDMNNDGKLDLVVAGAQPLNGGSGNFIQIFLGDGTGNFTLNQTVDMGRGNLKGDIALGDFNEDGKLDVAFPKTGNQDGSETRSVIVFIFFGDGAGTVALGPTLTVGPEPHTVVTADFNKDGHLDLAVTNRGDGTVTCLLGDGHGNFTTSSTTSVLSPLD